MILIRDKYYSRRDPTPPPFPFSDEMLEYLLNDPNATVIFNVEGKDRKMIKYSTSILAKMRENI